MRSSGVRGSASAPQALWTRAASTITAKIVLCISTSTFPNAAFPRIWPRRYLPVFGNGKVKTMKPSILKPAIVTAFGVAAVLGISFAALPVLAQLNEAAEIEAVRSEYRDAWQRGDLDRVMQFWTADAKAVGPGSVPTGTAAIRASLEQSVNMGIYDLRHEDRETYGRGDMVVEVTRSMLFDRSGKPVLSIRYMTLWQKSGGQWRIHREFAVPASAAQQP